MMVHFSFPFEVVIALTFCIQTCDFLFIEREFRYRKTRPGCPTKVIPEADVAYRLPVDSLLTCAAYCGKDVDCRSFNFWPKNCQISWTLLNDTCTNGVEDLGKYYYEKV